jgi:DnaK suppressor protein
VFPYADIPCLIFVPKIQNGSVSCCGLQLMLQEPIVESTLSPQPLTEAKNINATASNSVYNSANFAATQPSLGSGGTLARRFGVRMSEDLLEEGYSPSETEPFMNDKQRAYFRRKLMRWKEELIEEGHRTIRALQTETEELPDITDRASQETDRALELRERDRQRKLILKIDAALAQIDDGSYGYCEETGEPIGLKRLEARPIATLSIEAQERHERSERVHRDD